MEKVSEPLLSELFDHSDGFVSRRIRINEVLLCSNPQTADDFSNLQGEYWLQMEP